MNSILKSSEAKLVDIYEKMQIYIAVCEILTNTNDKECLQHAKKLLREIIDPYIRSIEKVSLITKLPSNYF